MIITELIHPKQNILYYHYESNIIDERSNSGFFIDKIMASKNAANIFVGTLLSKEGTSRDILTKPVLISIWGKTHLYSLVYIFTKLYYDSTSHF